MDIFLQYTLVLHILSGYTALMCGAVAMSTVKGGKRHRKWGLVFYYSMIVVSATAIVMAFAKNIDFLLYIGIFVLYQNFGGRKALRNKSQIPDIIDWVILAIAFVNGVAMMYTMEIVLLVFGGITMVLVATDLRLYIPALRGKKHPPKAWLSKHIGMMMGAYIGTLTAFLVVNVQFQPHWIVWLGPTIILVPLMRFWTVKYTKSTVR